MFEKAKLTSLINNVDNAKSIKEKGDSFELLSMYLFEFLEGVEIRGHDIHMRSEEIDIVLWNAQREDILRPWDPVILIECKNWTDHVDSKELDNFISKIRRRQLKTGIFIAANGVTGGFINGDGNEPGAVGIIRSALQEGIRVIVIRMEDIRMVNCLDDVRELIKERYCKLYVHRVF